MLLLHSRTGEICRAPVDLGGNALPPDLVWIDLLKPSPEEVAFVERATGLELPNFEALSEIESSSRLRAVNGALFLSAPLVYRSDADDPQATPVGFILTRSISSRCGLKHRPPSRLLPRPHPPPRMTRLPACSRRS